MGRSVLRGNWSRDSVTRLMTRSLSGRRRIAAVGVGLLLALGAGGARVAAAGLYLAGAPEGSAPDCSAPQGSPPQSRATPYPTPANGVPAAPSGAGNAVSLHTVGGKVVNGSGHEVQFTGVAWFGFETKNFAPHGLWARN